MFFWGPVPPYAVAQFSPMITQLAIDIHCVFWSLVYSKPSASGFPSDQFGTPPGMFGLNHVAVVGLHGMPGLVTGR